MTLFYPDLNVWLALSVESHSHYKQAWAWLNSLPWEIKIVFSRYTHLGLLRLLTNRSIMGEETAALKVAWSVYDRWFADPRVKFHPEPEGVDFLLRELTEPFADRAASRVIGDCYLLACARASGAALVTFDQALFALARQKSYVAVMPGTSV